MITTQACLWLVILQSHSKKKVSQHDAGIMSQVLRECLFGTLTAGMSTRPTALHPTGSRSCVTVPAQDLHLQLLYLNDCQRQLTQQLVYKTKEFCTYCQKSSKGSSACSSPPSSCMAPSIFEMLWINTYCSVPHFSVISRNFAQILKRSGQDTDWLSCVCHTHKSKCICDQNMQICRPSLWKPVASNTFFKRKLHIVEWPFQCPAQDTPNR